MQPLRVYVGLDAAEIAEERAELALRELIRVGGFDRKVLVVATPTGTGWLDPGAVDTVEYLHAGDTAIVSMQYSYLPSWLTILVDPARSRNSAKLLFDNPLTRVIDHSFVNNLDGNRAYDGLQRVMLDQQCELSGTTVVATNWQLEWTLDQLGNWTRFRHGPTQRAGFVRQRKDGPPLPAQRFRRIHASVRALIAASGPRLASSLARVDAPVMGGAVRSWI